MPCDHPIASGTGSAPESSTSTTIGVAARATDSVTGFIVLVAEQVDVQEVNTKTTLALATVAPDAAIAAPAAVTVRAEQRHHGTSRQQLHVLSLNLSKAQCIRHQILLGKAPPGVPGEKYLISDIADSVLHTLPAVMLGGNQ
jgi:hypothetical protein